MIIKKFLHSCLLLEEKGKRLLIDPGDFSFTEGKLTPADIGPIDVLLITHKHQDHYDPAAVRLIAGLKSVPIVTHGEVGAMLTEDGLQFERVHAGDHVEIEGFSIRAFEAPHERIPTGEPHNLAYVVNDLLLHPGDSYSVEGGVQCRVLALPVTAPWGRTVDALAFAERFRPETVIPIHDAYIKDFMLKGLYGMYENELKKRRISFCPLPLGSVFTVQDATEFPSGAMET